MNLSTEELRNIAVQQFLQAKFTLSSYADMLPTSSILLADADGKLNEFYFIETSHFFEPAEHMQLFPLFIREKSLQLRRQFRDYCFKAVIVVSDLCFIPSLQIGIENRAIICLIKQEDQTDYFLLPYEKSDTGEYSFFDIARKELQVELFENLFPSV